MTIEADTIAHLIGALTKAYENGESDGTLAIRANEILNPPPPERFANRESFSGTQVEGALCVYEWMMEMREDNRLIGEWWDGLGSPGMRMVSIQAGDICDRAFNHMDSMGYDFVAAYDFEFVPAICSMIDWDALCKDNQYDSGRYDPDINAMVITMIAADRARCCDPQRRSFQKKDKATPTPEQFVAECRIEADKQWCYSDLVSDHPEHVEQAMKADEDPAEFIEWLGQKYDLTPRAPAVAG